MLVKYYGLACDHTSEQNLPRTDFLSNGLFRITQPKYLNDKGSEAQLFPYFNEFSATDIAWAKKQYHKKQSDKSFEPSKEKLEQLFLKPMCARFGDNLSNMNNLAGVGAINEIDKDEFHSSVKRINNFLIEALSCKLGVLSMSKSDTNKLMWTHYATEGKGIALCFDEKHTFFEKFKPREVSYTPEKRATFTYYKGSIRVNGNLIKNFHLTDLNSQTNILQSLENQGVDVGELTERLLFSKAGEWVYENETRLVLPLDLCEEGKGEVITPKLDPSLPIEYKKIFNSYSEVYLKKVPFESFSSIVLGYQMTNQNKEIIKYKIKSCFIPPQA